MKPCEFCGHSRSVTRHRFGPFSGTIHNACVNFAFDYCLRIIVCKKTNPFLPNYAHFLPGVWSYRTISATSDELKRRCGVVCHASFVCVFLCFWLDNRPTRAGAALRAAPLERGWAITPLAHITHAGNAALGSAARSLLRRIVGGQREPITQPEQSAQGHGRGCSNRERPGGVGRSSN